MDYATIAKQVAEKGYASLTSGQKDIYNAGPSTPTLAPVALTITPTITPTPTSTSGQLSASDLANMQAQQQAAQQEAARKAAEKQTWIDFGKQVQQSGQGNAYMQNWVNTKVPAQYQFEVANAMGITWGTPTSTTSTITPTGATPATPISTPTIPTSNASGAIIAGAGVTSKSIEDYIKMLTPPSSTNQTTLESLMTSISADLTASGGQGVAQTAAEAAQGVPGLRTSLANVNAEILRKMAEYKALSTDVEGKPITMASITGAQAQIQKVQASEIGLLQAQALGLQGQLSAAQSIADRAVDLKYEDAKSALDIKLKQLELIQGELTKTEKIRADAITLYLNDQKAALAVQVANEKDINATILNLMQKYPDAGWSGMPKTVTEANNLVVQNSAIYKKEATAVNVGTANGITDVQLKQFINKQIATPEFQKLSDEDKKLYIQSQGGTPYDYGY